MPQQVISKIVCEIESLSSWKRHLLYAFAMLCITVCAMVIFKVKIAFNSTDSLAGKIYLVKADSNFTPRYLEHIYFKPPLNGVYKANRTFMKLALGVPGDLITRKGQQILINGIHVADVQITGKLFPLYPIKEGVIPDGYYYLGSNKENGFDSRYDAIGLVPRSRILGWCQRIL